MKFFSSLITLSLVSVLAKAAPAAEVDATLTKRAAPVNQLTGYATLNGGTTGGTGGTTTTVTTLSALRAAVSGTAKKIVRISGIIQGDGEVVDVGSYTTLLGVNGGGADGLIGGGLRVKQSKNVIIRNLRLSKSVAPTDLIQIQYSTNVWIDHNEFSSDLTHDKDYYDGAMDIQHGSDYITVSWNYFHDHFKTSLVGHSESASAKAEDTGHLRVTYHHNRFENVNSRLPSVRFGTLHAYSNYYKNIADSGINLRNGAQGLVEANLFESVTNPIQTALYKGFVVSRNNIFTNSDAPDLSGVGSLTTVPYTYTIDAASTVAAIVTASAGVEKISV
ncbi:pectin lyase-like protein [Mrakia frigida]|uniref:pectate lyase family protein n=1 Tax=Mrakia frigida TaxID=29902 RepID=UPI003FCC15BA